MKPWKRILISVFALTLASGCQTTTGRYVTLMYESLTHEAQSVSRDAAAGIPFATIGLQVRGSDQVLLILATNENDVLEWDSPRLTVKTRQGRVIQTAGFPFNLNSAVVNHGNYLPAIGRPYQIVMDFQDLNLFGAVAECTTVDDGAADLSILGARIVSRHLVENCEIASVGWSFKNEYWVDTEAHFVWRSIQYVYPRSPPLTIEVLRPPLSATG
jgi:hypothetical protein